MPGRRLHRVVAPEVLQNILRLALADRGSQALAVVRDLLRHDLPAHQVLSAVIVPVLRDVGDLWHANLIDVEAQQTASAVLERVLSESCPNDTSPPGDGDWVVIAAPLLEQHTFCAQVAAMCLRANGWNVLDLGGGVRAADLGVALDAAGARAQRVAAVVVHTARPACLPGVFDLVEVARDRGVGVAAGGRGFGKEGQWSQHLGIGAWVAAVGAVGDSLSSTRPVPGESVVTEASRIAASRVAAQRDVLAAAPGPWSAALPAAAVGDIAPTAFLADALASSVQFAEAEIMVDAVKWYRGFLASRGSPVQAVREVLDELAAVFTDEPYCAEPVAQALASMA